MTIVKNILLPLSIAACVLGHGAYAKDEIVVSTCSTANLAAAAVTGCSTALGFATAYFFYKLNAKLNKQIPSAAPLAHVAAGIAREIVEEDVR